VALPDRLRRELSRATTAGALSNTIGITLATNPKPKTKIQIQKPKSKIAKPRDTISGALGGIRNSQFAIHNSQLILMFAICNLAIACSKAV